MLPFFINISTLSVLTMKALGVIQALGKKPFLSLKTNCPLKESTTSSYLTFNKFNVSSGVDARGFRRATIMDYFLPIGKLPLMGLGFAS